MTDSQPKRRRHKASPAGAILEAEGRANRAIKNALGNPHCGVRILSPAEGPQMAARMLRDCEVAPKLRHYVGPLDIGCTDQYQQFQVAGARFAYRLHGPSKDQLATAGLHAIVSDPQATVALGRVLAEDPAIDPVLTLRALGFASGFVRASRTQRSRAS